MGDAPTIQAGVDSAAAGDTVQVWCGTYREHDVVVATPLVLRSVTGLAECVTIDAQGSGAGLLFPFEADTDVHLAGLSIVNCVGAFGPAVQMTNVSGTITDCRFFGNVGTSGGALDIRQSSVEIVRCTFEDNTVDRWGGAANCWDSRIAFEDCTFRDNVAASTGGAVYLKNNESSTFDDCLFVDNTAGYAGALFSLDPDLRVTGCLFAGNVARRNGGALYVQGASVLTVERCTLWNNSAEFGSAFFAQGGVLSAAQCVVAEGRHGRIARCTESGTVSLTCCVAHRNMGGDWIGCVAGQNGIDGNVTADPLLCDPENDDFTIRSDSPCAPDAGDCGAIGAFPVACARSAVEEMSWGIVKARYR